MLRVGTLCAALGLLLLVQTPVLAIDVIHVGVKGGYSVANQSTDPGDSELADSRSGLALGGYIGIPLTPAISIQPEALFSMKGDSEEAGGVTGSLKLNYIEVPVLAKATFMRMSAAHPSIFAGPSVAYNLSAKAGVEGMGPLDGDVDVKDSMNSVDFGLVFGGGLEFPMAGGAKTLGIDLRYTMGLTNTVDSDTGAEAKNNVISIMGTLGFL